MFPHEQKSRMEFKQIKQGIRDGSIFGAAEVDLHVPEHLKGYFEELTPIFKHAKVTFEDIGEHMQEFINEPDKGRTYKDRNYLIGSMFANKILLITPLLRWYMDHGIEVSKIHQIVQFKPSR